MYKFPTYPKFILDKWGNKMSMLETATDEWLFDVLSDFCQIALHALLVLRVDDGDELFHLRADLFHLDFVDFGRHVAFSDVSIGDSVSGSFAFVGAFPV